MEAVAELRRRRRPGGRDLQRLPGAHRGGAAARRAAEEPGPALPLHDGGRAGVHHPHRAHRARPRSVPSCALPINHFEGNYTCDAATLRALCAPRTASCCATRDNPNGSLDDIAGVCNEAGNVVGLMPHPERACDALTASHRRHGPARVARGGRRPARRRLPASITGLTRPTRPASRSSTAVRVSRRARRG